MKQYEIPSCEVDIIEQEQNFLQSVEVSSDPMPSTPVQPFHSRGFWEEDDYE